MHTQWTPLYSIVGERGNLWQQLDITVIYKPRISSKRRLIFEAVRGDGYLGDIAIDDVALQGESCIIKGKLFINDLGNQINIHNCFNSESYNLTIFAKEANVNCL